MLESSTLLLQPFEFVYVLLDSQGKVTGKYPNHAEEWIEQPGGLNLELVSIPGGLFQMGTQYGMGYPDETPRHLVSISPFFLGRSLVTQDQWQRVMGRMPPCRFRDPNLPVMNVSWEGASAFCHKLSKQTGRSYHLPSEAQWEFACRAGASGPFHTGDTLTTDYANFVGQPAFRSEPTGIYRHVVTPSGTFPANPFGLYDMHGNLWEWCADNWHEDYTGAPFDGAAWTWGGEVGYRVTRGGSWHEPALNCRSATRLRVREKDDDEFLGFRVALSPYSSARQQSH